MALNIQTGVERPRSPRMSFHARQRMRQRLGVELTEDEVAEIVDLAQGAEILWTAKDGYCSRRKIVWRGHKLHIGVSPRTGDVMTVLETEMKATIGDTLK